MTENADEVQSMNVARGSQNSHRPGHIPARILWPALGFPAVIAPDSRSDGSDATNSICLLILTKRKITSKKQVAAHLRIAPWDERRARSASEGKEFKEDDVLFRSDADRDLDFRALGLTRAIPPVDDHAIVFDFGYDLKPADTTVWQRGGVTVGLSRFVLKFYDALNYSRLYEIRVSKEASAALGAGLYNLYWVNASTNDSKQDISDEMSLLMEHRAKPTREELLRADQLNKGWEQSFAARLGDDEKLRAEWLKYLLSEYEYEYGALHLPYAKGGSPNAQQRTEVLHPLFILPKAIESLRIGHVTDLHFDVRADVFEDNLKKERERIEKETQMDSAAKSNPPPGDQHVYYGDKSEVDETIKKRKLQKEVVNANFNNWNKSSSELYYRAQKYCDILLVTGDLVDYGRGHAGIAYRETLGIDSMYHADRNWFLFYYFFGAGNSYQKPAYTILGNHDWRINPYPPLAVAGAPDPRELIHDYMKFRDKNKSQKEWTEKLEEVIRMAHGPGHEKKFSYSLEASSLLEFKNEDPDEFNRALRALLSQTKTMDIKGAATETTVESIAWYLLLINPFLNYSFRLPGGHDVLMLDWAEDEEVLSPLVVDGKEWYYLPTQAGAAALTGPRAKNCLSDLQKSLVAEFVGKPGAAKVIGIHSPPIGPHVWWTDDKLEAGVMKHARDERVPGSAKFTTESNGTTETWYGHPLFAVSPKGGMVGQQADYGSFQRNRDWFISEVRKQDAHVRLVLSGHIHRYGLFALRSGSDADGSYDKGQLLIRLVQPNMAHLVAITAPLYVNTTSAGPRGHRYPFFKSTRMESHEDLGYSERKLESTNDVIRIPVVETYVDPGYSELELASDGKLKAVEFKSLRD